jgi:hypothetical protein
MMRGIGCGRIDLGDIREGFDAVLQLRYGLRLCSDRVRVRGWC